ncbi:MAG: gamma-glutamylcyclotransferase, partial [Verrucomicrobiae bacterium]|nr:gamma-glutamylcyclotransferase [Verrucomicrobiae bacterium]
MTLFAYGTLLVPRIWRGVVGREFPNQPATLPGFAIYRVEGADFPGIIPSEGASIVPGRLFTGLDAEALARL